MKAETTPYDVPTSEYASNPSLSGPGMAAGERFVVRRVITPFFGAVVAVDEPEPFATLHGAV